MQSHKSSSNKINALKQNNRSARGIALLWIGLCGCVAVAACSPPADTDTDAKPVMKIAEPQREALDKAKETSQALEAAAIEQKQVIDQASE